MTEESQAEEIAKYKRVLSLARSSLEANQATIAAKDQQIAQLIKALEDEKSNNKTKKVLAKEEEAALIPRRILCRVDVDDLIWILIEFEDYDDAWKCMHGEQDLEDFIQRVPGVPLVCPAKCLSPEESNRIMEDSKKKVERIVEEFRRYKVRTEIAKKQKDAETRQAVLNGTNSTAPHPAITLSAYSSSGISGSHERALTMGSFDHHATNRNNNSGDSDSSQQQAGDELTRLRATLAEQETRWRKACEALTKENEALRSKGGESLLATQWRGRYESCMKEKEELLERLDLHAAWTNAVNSSGKSMEQAYIDLQEEFGNFRKKLAAIDRRRQRSTTSAALSSSAGEAGGGSSSGSGGVATGVADSELAALLREYEMNAANSLSMAASNGSPRMAGRGGGSSSSGGSAGSSSLGNVGEDDHHSSGGSGGSSSAGADGSAGMTASKIKYVRHMVFQYLSCREPEVRSHMETALMAIFRMSAEEREVIESRRREEATDTLTSITSFLGSLGT